MKISQCSAMQQFSVNRFTGSPAGFVVNFKTFFRKAIFQKHRNALN